jgi:hypothetical protein
MPVDDNGPDSGTGSTGRDMPTASPRATPRSVVVMTQSMTSDVKTDPVKPAPKEEGPETHSLNLGITKLNITPGAGLLGLPGLSFG